MTTILDDIIAYKQQEVTRLTAEEEGPDRTPISLKDRLDVAGTISIIGEVKRASPSKGDINIGMEPDEQAEKYAAGGADAISVLTDDKYFKGSMADLEAVRKVVALPVLNKDFIIDERQIDRAYRHGADVILLIVAALDDEALERLFAYASSYGLECIVEVHTADEMERALKLHPALIGINSRNLKTFEVDLGDTEKLLETYGHHPVHFIAESGIRTTADGRRMRVAGAAALLVGETLMAAEDPAATIRALKGVL
ncbi:indole-3-glycerol phosphate synthase TrpC [Salinicoccus siamensis]|uniref:Indole-3-glycerol phosphate synthase n=1 Tax=Salinicoccus siamensis TaxID=381830 RepID=A0ABV5Z2J6_9STAP